MEPTEVSYQHQPKFSKVLTGFLTFARFLKSAPQCSRCLNDILVEKHIQQTTVTQIRQRRKSDRRPLSILPLKETRDAGIQHYNSELTEATLSINAMELIDSLIQMKERTKEDKETMDVITKLFTAVAGDDEEIGWAKLKKLLDAYLQKEFEFEGFSREVCRSMVAMVDLDRTGKLGLDEFSDLWTSILCWKNVFKTFDEDGSGTLNSFELRNALNSAGYLINNQVLKSLVLRYGDEDGCISFEDFIMCSVKLKVMIDSFKDKDTHGKNEANFTLTEWVELTTYA